MAENMVKISTEEYAKLQAAKVYLTILRDMCLNDSSLSYDSENLTFRDTTICSVLMTMFPMEYTARILTLKRRREGEE